MEKVQPSSIRNDINKRFADAVNYLLEKKLAYNKNEVMNNLGLYLGRLTLVLTGRGNASTDNIALLCQHYGVSVEWILLGTGPFFSADASAERPTVAADSAPQAELASDREGAIPLIPLAALAGFNGIDEPGVSIADCPRYHVPEFASAGADFLIRVQGTSMVPTFQSGDLVACRKLEKDAWVDYGDPYLIDGQQGIMVKRIFNHASDPDKLLCKSDNPDVAPFAISKAEVRSLSKVLGVVRTL